MLRIWPLLNTYTQRAVEDNKLYRAELGEYQNELTQNEKK